MERNHRAKSKGGRKRVVDKILSQHIVRIVSRDPSQDLDTLVESLRQAVPEYGRQKRQPFTWHVQSCSTYLREEGLYPLPKESTSQDPRLGQATSDSDAEEDAVQQSTLNMNASVTRMYMGAGAAGAESTGPGASDAQLLEGRDVSHGQRTTTVPASGKVPKAARKAGAKERVKRARPDGDGSAPSGPRKAAAVAPKDVRYRDLGGIEPVLDDIRQLIERPLHHPEVYAWLGVEPPRGVLLYGPPGCGKTALANAIANECGVPFFRIAAPEVVSGMSGESEAKLRSLFAAAAAAAPSILFIDEIDAIAPKRESAQREMERRIVAQMLTCMDDLCQFAQGAAQRGSDDVEAAADRDASGTRSGRHVVVIGATNRPDALDAALRRAGRFDREIALGIPTEAARAAILAVVCRGLRLTGDFDFAAIARATPGFVGADLAALAKEAAAIAVRRIFATSRGPSSTAEVEDSGTAAMADDDVAPSAPAAAAAAPGEDKAPSQRDAVPGSRHVARFTASDLAGLAITMDDFGAAVLKVQPSVRREGFSTKPDVSWDDVGALEAVREELHFAITEPVRNPEAFAALGLASAAGVLLFGPPGCGKTLLAKAAAASSGANFISIKGPELLNKYVGESERAVRSLFSRARAARPCVLFFDELDALAPRRGASGDAGTGGGAAPGERIVNQLLTEMDGTGSREGVFLVGATNRPDIIDPALLRPGRLDKTLYVPLPDGPARGRILAALARRSPVAAGVDLAALVAVDACNGMSGADMAAVLREAGLACLKERLKADDANVGAGNDRGTAAAQALTIQLRHFQDALRSVRPSVSAKDARAYERLRTKLLSARGHIVQSEPATVRPASAAGDDASGAATGADDMETVDG